MAASALGQIAAFKKSRNQRAHATDAPPPESPEATPSDDKENAAQEGEVRRQLDFRGAVKGTDADAEMQGEAPSPLRHANGEDKQASPFFHRGGGGGDGLQQQRQQHERKDHNRGARRGHHSTRGGGGGSGRHHSTKRGGEQRHRMDMAGLPPRGESVRFIRNSMRGRLVSLADAAAYEHMAKQQPTVYMNAMNPGYFGAPPPLPLPPHAPLPKPFAPFDWQQQLYGQHHVPPMAGPAMMHTAPPPPYYVYPPPPHPQQQQPAIPPMMMHPAMMMHPHLGGMPGHHHAVPPPPPAAPPPAPQPQPAQAPVAAEHSTPASAADNALFAQNHAATPGPALFAGTAWE